MISKIRNSEEEEGNVGEDESAEERPQVLRIKPTKQPSFMPEWNDDMFSPECCTSTAVNRTTGPSDHNFSASMQQIGYEDNAKENTNTNILNSRSTINTDSNLVTPSIKFSSQKI